MSEIDNRIGYEKSNDAAWEILFEKYNILKKIENDGIYQISASAIKEYREPRLMSKFDHTINLPKIFKENRLSILPISRGEYVISKFYAYHEFETFPDCTNIKRMTLPSWIQSLKLDALTSEAVALNCAYISGIMEDFLEEECLIPTVCGRMSSGEFEYFIKGKTTHKIQVNNSQIEIDAGYEGIGSLAIIEAKRDLSEDFLVRQLYYPYRTWIKRVSKEVRPVFVVYSNGIFYLYEYSFCNSDEYSSIQLKRYCRYTVEEDMNISTEEIIKILKSVKCVEEPKIPFPQADKFDRVVNLCELLFEHPMTSDEITCKYAFDMRQTKYYTDAARYLGLIKKEKLDVITYNLTEYGRNILKSSYKQRQLEFCKAILSHKIFADCLSIWFRRGNIDKNQDIIPLMKKSNLYNIESDETYKRRASTIKGWLDWIVRLISED